MPWAHRTMWGVCHFGDPWHWGLEINSGQLSHPAHGMTHSNHSQRVGSVSLHSHPSPEYTWFHKNIQKACIHSLLSNQNEQVPSPMAMRWAGEEAVGLPL